MIIPCDQCLVKAACTKNCEVSATCPYLFYSIVNNQGKNKNIVDKLRRIEELFNVETEDGDTNYNSRLCFTLYPTVSPVYSVVMYSIVNYQYRQLDIINAYKPNIDDLTEVGKNRWRLVLRKEDIWERKVDNDTM